jgi:pimeloyl-ACP methyl ester carboxylesterase
MKPASLFNVMNLVPLATLSLVVAATIAGCIAPPAARTQQLATRNGFQPVTLQGTKFQHRAFARDARGAGHTRLLVLFLEGDGSPWIDAGRRVAADPTPQRPLALELAIETPASAAVLYLARPCYEQAARPPECTERLWTSHRYSTEVVDSLSAAASRYITEHQFERVVLVGYSGGATLAALMAKSVPHVIGLVSVAGNLDPDEWANLHGYLPLTGSLNPSLQPPLPADLPQWYLVGERDTNVPAEATARYFERVPRNRVWSYPGFDHRCCWVGEWRSAFAKIAAEAERPN